MNQPTGAIAREIKQTKPFASTGHQVVVALLRTADVIHQRAARLLEPHGITPQQYNVLRILRGAGPRGLPTLSIAERMLQRSPGITRMIDRLEAKGWVARARRSADRRCVDCTITAAGLELLARLDDPVDAADRDAVAKLDDAGIDQLIRSLDVIRAASA